MTLAEYMAREGLTLTALAQRLERPVSTVHAWLKGQRRPDWDSLADIRAKTGGAVAPADFLPAQSAPREAVAAAPPRPGFAEAQAGYGGSAGLATEARALGLDPEAIAAKAIQDAIRAEKARRWLEENRDAIEAHNAWVEEHGVPLAKYRMF